jgi:hypothetical protein
MNEDEWATLVSRANVPKNHDAYNLAKAFITLVQATPLPQQPHYYHAALATWHTPEWVHPPTAHAELSSSTELQASHNQQTIVFQRDGYPKLNQLMICTLAF